MFQKGDFVTINQNVGIVVMTGEELPGPAYSSCGKQFS